MTKISNTLLLKKITELTEISNSSLNQFVEIANQKFFKKGDILLNEGEICKSIFFIESGQLRTYLLKDGSEINIDFIFEGQFTTNLESLINSTPADSNIVAMEDTCVFEIDRDKLLDLYKVSSEIESFGRKLLEQLLLTKEEHSNLFKIYSPTERYQYLLNHKPAILQRVSLTHLSSYLGITRETLSRIRSKIV